MAVEWAAATGALTALRAALALAKESKNTELINQIIDLQSKILDLQAELTRLHEENRELTEELKRRDELSETAGQLEVKDGMYWRRSGGDGPEGPFCPTCWDDDRKLIRLTPGATEGTFSCPKHGTSYWTEDLRERLKEAPTKLTPGGPDGWMGR